MKISRKSYKKQEREDLYKKKLHASTALSVLSSLLPVQNGAYRVPWSLYQYDILSLKLLLIMLEIHPKTQFMDAYILESCHVSPLKPKQKVALISRPLLRYGQIEFVSCPYDVCDIRLEAQRGREKDTAHKEWWEETRDHFSPAVRDLIFPPLNTENRNSTGHDITLSGEPTSLQTAKRETSSLHKTVALRVLWWSNASSCEKQK